MPVKSKKPEIIHVLIKGGLADLNVEVAKIVEKGYRLLLTQYLSGDLVNNIFSVFYIFSKDGVVVEE